MSPSPGCSADLEGKAGDPLAQFLADHPIWPLKAPVKFRQLSQGAVFGQRPVEVAFSRPVLLPLLHTPDDSISAACGPQEPSDPQAGWATGACALLSRKTQGIL